MTTADEERQRWDADPSLTAVWAADGDGVSHCLDMILPAIDDLHTEGAWMLDLGCGIGRLARPMARSFPESQIVGVDLSEAMIAQALAATTEGVLYCVGDGRDIGLMPRVIGGWSTLMFQHIPPEAQYGYLDQIANLLLPGGVFVLQFTIGTGRSDYNHPMSPQHIQDWTVTTPLTATFKKDSRFPTWRWAHFIKDPA